MSQPWLEGLFTMGKALLPGLANSPAAMLQMAVRAAGDRVIGKRLTMRAGDADVELTPVVLDTELDTVGLALGQVPHIRIVAEDVTWPSAPLSRLAITCENVRIQSLPVPSVVAGSVDLEITVSADVVRAKVAELQPNLVVDIGEDSVVRLRWAKHPSWGHLEVEPTLDPAAGLILAPQVLQAAGMRFSAVRRLQPTVVEVPDLPRGLRLTAVEPGPGELVLRGEAERWRETIPITEVITWLATAAATLTLPRFPT
ncbi:LmeA family phospholipid-binding protein [Actinocrispum sp. NPDC049592]|uniref:LmeA family phospholipid-binding protein n=1 Tax=Actinocrispum sp. NPDC049592 TaxID=3154835 RepID=UPI0034418A27